MAPKKKARTGQRANVTPGETIDPIIDDAGEHPKGKDIPPTTTPPDSTIPVQTAPIPTPTEGAANQPLTNILVLPPALASGLDFSEGDLRGAIQMLAQIVASQAHRSNVAPTSFSQPGESTSSRANRFLKLNILRVMRATEM